MRSNKRIVIVAVVAAWATRTARAQSVTGVALDDSSRTPLVASTIRLLDRSEHLVAETRTDSAGMFYITGPARGWYTLLIRRSEGGAFRSRSFELTPDSVLQKSFAVPLLPQALRPGPFIDEVARPAAFRAGNVPPRFPDYARRHGERGMVVAFMIVRPDGRVDMKTVYLISTSEEFADAVHTSLQFARFFPAERDGQRCAQVVQVSYGFAYGSEPVDGDVTIHVANPSRNR